MPSMWLVSTSPGCKKRGGLRAATDAGRRAGEDHVTGQQRQDGGQCGDQARHTEHHVGGAARLHHLTVDAAAEFQVVRVGDLVRRDQARAHGAEARERLAERELPAAAPLHDALGQVLADGESGNVTPGRVLVDPVRVRADHHDQFDLPVDHARGQGDVDVRAGDAGGKLGERRRPLRHGHPRLGGVPVIVEADAKHLRRSRRRRTEVGIDDGRGGRAAHTVRPGAKGIPLCEHRLRVGREPSLRRRLHINTARLGEQRQSSTDIGYAHRSLRLCFGARADRGQMTRPWQVRATNTAALEGELTTHRGLPTSHTRERVAPRAGTTVRPRLAPAATRSAHREGPSGRRLSRSIPVDSARGAPGAAARAGHPPGPRDEPARAALRRIHADLRRSRRAADRSD